MNYKQFCKSRKLWFKTEINGMTWKVYVAKDLRTPDENAVRCHGICFGTQREIYVLEETAADPQMAVETVLHELTHAIYGSEEIEDDEEIVQMLGNRLYQCLRNFIKFPKLPK